MSHRGRGLLEIKPSSNPFFQTTNSDIGINVQEVKDTQWKVDGKAPVFHHSKHKVDGNFAFLYTRESDRIGSKVNKPVMKDVRVLTKTEFLKKKMEDFSDPNGVEYEDDSHEINDDIPFKRTAEDVLKVYKHIPKYEDARYTTSMVKLIHDVIYYYSIKVMHWNIHIK